ncbi:MAG: hypothetical protein A3A80_02255 [Candidatus Terrybacteria bacterium RIFCSPLOWO2_01_FULL_44_24]|uniref:Chromosomal replication initiator protein DnaA n=1 Tax=Candidatus Terrybacteria bacterium RIFCSPHIGHO2_01_FULL_43_35 TaxID=1802361 RepID=A0A1G2PEF3_9BACT|nr:MAG: hypothetical protein A2828_02045 [Candidatus Terrybacteria bacterium RIFCSPHIGHO2_01_FULL_43_35]OHA50901.1 MAG: hypothetical protein A3A80_02255 [Candidatus Terrybacteria bacterium RIFCSPLOWO2_01_FULL_44_24]
MTKDDLWQLVLGELELSLSRANFITWFQKTVLYDKKDGLAVVSVPNAFAKEWLETKYRKPILKSLRTKDNEIRDIQFVVGKTQHRENGVSHAAKNPASAPSILSLPLQHSQVDRETNLNPRYTFDGFVIGQFNELAHAAAKAVTERTGMVYNPLFIYGGVGLGKTHLLQAVGNALMKKRAGLKIRYISCEKFTNDFVSSIKNRTIDEFKEKYRQLDVLIIDDIQFIAGKERTQEELFHTFNALSTENKQVVFSSDRPPKAIPTLEERLRSRFEGGMIADITPPDFETRMAILKTKSVERGLLLSEQTLTAIANIIQKNIRELEGALNRVAMVKGVSATSGQVDISPNEIHKLLSGTIKVQKKCSWRDVIRVVADFYDIEEREILEKSRRQEVVRPRQVTMYILREELRNSYPFIGRKIGGRDHTTVMHACEKIEEERRTNGQIFDEINTIKERLRLHE